MDENFNRYSVPLAWDMPKLLSKSLTLLSMCAFVNSSEFPSYLVVRRTFVLNMSEIYDVRASCLDGPGLALGTSSHLALLNSLLKRMQGRPKRQSTYLILTLQMAFSAFIPKATFSHLQNNGLVRNVPPPLARVTRR